MVQLIRHKLSHRLARGLAGVGLLLVALVLLSDRADGAQAITAGISPLYYFGMHRESVEDMRVKVLGGHIRVTRNWDANKWYINRQWDPLKDAGGSYRLSTGSGGTSTGGTGPGGGTIGETPPGPWQLDRAGQRYRWVSGNTYVHSTNPRLTITKTDTGWRWQNRQGHWMDYDDTRKAIAYGDRNNVRVTLSYDADDRLTGVFDHLGKQILWVEYNTDNLISAIRDYTLRRIEYHYTNKQLTEVIDVRGHAWGYGYEGQYLKTKTDPEGRITTISYVGSLVASILDSAGIGTHYKYEYDKTKKEFYKQEKTTAGKVTETWYDKEGDTGRIDINGQTVSTIVKDGRREIVTDSVGNKTIKLLDEWENITQITHADGSTVSYKYNPVYSTILEKTNENGFTTKYEYDPHGNLIKMTGALGRPEQRITEYGYDLNGYGNLTSVKPLGDAVTQEAETIYTYDAFGNFDTHTDPEGHIIDYLEYDAIGNATQWKDGRGKLWQRSYDNAGNLLSETNPLLHVTRYQYDKYGKPTHVFDPYDQATEYKYDQNNRMYVIVEHDGATVQRKYNANGQLEEVVDQEGKSIRYRYDTQERRSTVTDGNGNVITYKYGETGTGANKSDISSTIYPTYTEQYHYDNRGRLTTIVKVAQEYGELVSRAVYDHAGNVIERIDEEGKQTKYEYDALNRQKKATDTLNHTVTYAYDNRDNLISVTNENNIVIRRFDYDRNSRQLTETWPSNETFTTTYDPNGNLEEKIDAKGQVTQYVYDDASRLDQIQYFASAASLTPAKTVDMAYDKLDRITGYNDGATSSSVTFDDLARTRTESINFGPFTKTFTEAYYNNGRKKALTTPEGITYSYTYDAGNRLSSLNIPGEGTITYNTYQWSEPTKITLPGGSAKEYQYDALMRINHITGRDPAGNAVLDYSYVYDKVGNIRTKTTEHGAYTYGYDDLHRLRAATNPTLPNEVYTYDPAGNRKTDDLVTGEWQYNDNNQLKTYGGVSVNYDLNGSLKDKTENGQTLTFVYNIENRLSEVRDNSQSTLAKYDYDPSGRRLWKEVGGVKRYFLYANEGLIAEYDATGNMLQTYGYAPGRLWGTRPLFTATSAGYAYYHHDHLGTPHALARPNGAVAWAAQARAFGTTSVTASTMTSHLRFPGQYYEQEIGLHYNWNRYYEPGSGRYISSDPMGIDGGLNTYAYAHNNPLKNIDPKGLKTEEQKRQKCIKRGMNKCNSNTLITGGFRGICKTFGGYCDDELERVVDRCKQNVVPLCNCIASGKITERDLKKKVRKRCPATKMTCDQWLDCAKKVVEEICS